MTNDIKKILNQIGYYQHIHEHLTLKPKELDILAQWIINSQEEMEKLRSTYIGEKLKNDKARGMIRFIAYNSERPLTITELNKVYNILGGDDNE